MQKLQFYEIEAEKEEIGPNFKMDTIDQAIANFERLEFKNIRLYPYIPPINDKQEIEIIKTKLQKAREINSLHAFWLELELAEQIEGRQEYLLATKTFQSLIEGKEYPLIIGGSFNLRNRYKNRPLYELSINYLPGGQRAFCMRNENLDSARAGFINFLQNLRYNLKI